MNTTTVQNETVDLDELFNGIGADEILTANKSNFLSRKGDMKAIDAFQPDNKQPVKVTPKVAEPIATNKPVEESNEYIPADTSVADDILKSIDLELHGDEEVVDTTTPSDKGRPKTEKNSLVSYLKDKIVAKQYSAFEDWDEKKEDIDTYLSKQPEKTLHEMLDANWAEKERELLERTPKEFFEALPSEFQYAAKYLMEGGTDLKTLFGALARVEETKALTPDTEGGQEAIARNYLRATNFGTEELIEEQVNEWKDGNLLEKKAKSFKPRLDKMQEEQVQYQIAQQQEINQKNYEAAQAYQGMVTQTLQKGEINGIKINRKKQEELYNGLLSLNYSNRNGNPTNLLGHMLDKIQYMEPNFDLLVEATYLLSDPKGYRDSIMQSGKNAATTDMVKKLKTEQQMSTGNSYESDEVEKEVGRKKLFKPRNMFERTK